MIKTILKMINNLDQDDLNKINELCGENGHSCNHGKKDIETVHQHENLDKNRTISIDNEFKLEYNFDIDDDTDYDDYYYEPLNEYMSGYISQDKCRHCLMYGENKVCGYNGIEYINACTAECNGIDICINDHCSCQKEEVKVGQILNFAIRNAYEEEATILFRDHENIHVCLLNNE